MMLSSTTVENGIFSKQGAFKNSHTSGGTQNTVKSGAGDLNLDFDASCSNSLYQNDLNEIRVNALFGLNLIKAF